MCEGILFWSVLILNTDYMDFTTADRIGLHQDPNFAHSYTMISY